MRIPTRGRPPLLDMLPVPRVGVVLLAAAVAAVAAACGGEAGGAAPGGGPTAPVQTASPAAVAYLNAALDTMQRYSINRSRIAWPQFRATALGNAGAAQTPAQTYPALAAAVRALGDNHSGFFQPGTFPGISPARLPAAVPGLAAQAGGGGRVAAGRMLDARTAYVSVPGFAGANPVGRADSTVAVVRALDDSAGALGPCGWVVDLRDNPGGNMYPMIAGLGPVLGDGVAGVFATPDSVRSPWYVRGGAAGVVSPQGVEFPLLRVSAPYALRRAAPPVAVLTGPNTASSGEATAISFRGRPNARSFGDATFGVSTANQPFVLSDRAVLNLTVAVMGDRTGRLYGGRVPPDEPAADALAAARAWLAARPECAP